MTEDADLKAMAIVAKNVKCLKLEPEDLHEELPIADMMSLSQEIATALRDVRNETIDLILNSPRPRTLERYKDFIRSLKHGGA